MTRRKHIALATQLAVALRQLGLAKPRLDHSPPLALREKVEHPDGSVTYIPAEDDPDHLQWLDDGGEERPAGSHNRKTYGMHATTAGSDSHAIAKTKRITNQQAAFRTKLLRKTRVIENVEQSRRVRQASRWPHRPMRGSKGRG